MTQITTAPAHGQASIDGGALNGRVIYEPQQGFTGQDSFVVSFSSGRYTSPINVTVNP